MGSNLFDLIFTFSKKKGKKKQRGKFIIFLHQNELIGKLWYYLSGNELLFYHSRDALGLGGYVIWLELELSRSVWSLPHKTLLLFKGRRRRRCHRRVIKGEKGRERAHFTAETSSLKGILDTGRKMIPA